MATVEKNLSHFDKANIPNTKGMSIGIVVSKWNDKITSNLLLGAKQTLLDLNVEEHNIHIHYVPGTFELPLGAQYLLEHTNVNGVIALGSVIQGETKHFDFVCQGATNGIKDLNISLGIPVIFGVLTDNTMDQAINRSGGKHGNKGVEAAITAIKMADLNQN